MKIILDSNISYLLVLRIENQRLFMNFYDVETVDNDELSHRKNIAALKNSKRHMQIEKTMISTKQILNTKNTQNEDKIL